MGIANASICKKLNIIEVVGFSQELLPDKVGESLTKHRNQP